MTLDHVLNEAASDIGAVEITRTAEGAAEFRVGDRLIALVTHGVGEFCLDPSVAAAARRTPDATGSDRGPAWVRFAPATLDAHAADRARAWLGSAARLAAG